ncbi:MAG: AHH domain-containing protein [Cyanobacteria bacterium J06643_5]
MIFSYDRYFMGQQVRVQKKASTIIGDTKGSLTFLQARGFGKPNGSSGGGIQRKTGGNSGNGHSFGNLMVSPTIQRVAPRKVVGKRSGYLRKLNSKFTKANAKKTLNKKIKKQIKKSISSKKRPKNASYLLAMARWKNKGKNKGKNKRPNVNFREWKKGYEAQHILPWAEVAKFKRTFKMERLNESWNGMMLPSGRANAASPEWKKNTRFKNRPYHVGKNGRIAHPDYSKMVYGLLMKESKNNVYRLTLKKVKNLAQRLRVKTKNTGGGKYIDDM